MQSKCELWTRCENLSPKMSPGYLPTPIDETDGIEKQRRRRRSFSYASSIFFSPFFLYIGRRSMCRQAYEKQGKRERVEAKELQREEERRKRMGVRTVGILRARTDCSNDQTHAHRRECDSKNYRKREGEATTNPYHHYRLSSCFFFFLFYAFCSFFPSLQHRGNVF